MQQSAEKEIKQNKTNCGCLSAPIAQSNRFCRVLHCHHSAPVQKPLPLSNPPPIGSAPPAPGDAIIEVPQNPPKNKERIRLLSRTCLSIMNLRRHKSNIFICCGARCSLRQSAFAKSAATVLPPKESLCSCSRSNQTSKTYLQVLKNSVLIIIF